MKNLEFPALTERDVEVRIQSAFDDGCRLLLYKDARCDMNQLDELVGNMNWQRSHSRDNANCTVSIYDAGKEQWISKEDTGTQSNTEKEKGQASDSFKRACFNWGIGRELYTAPKILVWHKDKNGKENYKKQKGKNTPRDDFKVERLAVNKDKRIYGLSIINERTGSRVFQFYDKSLDDTKKV